MSKKINFMNSTRLTYYNNRDRGYCRHCKTYFQLDDEYVSNQGTRKAQPPICLKCAEKVGLI
jgi:hypothetical protein